MDQETVVELLKKYIGYLRNHDFGIQKAYLFGSYANGKYHEDSDIDLALVMNDLPNSFTAQVELMKISRKFDTRIEPHPFEASDFNAANPFANEIINRGIPII